MKENHREPDGPKISKNDVPEEEEKKETFQT